MKLFIDCEFNGFGGPLISMAVVAEDGEEFYEVLPLPAKNAMHPWVRENVIPNLEKASVSRQEFQATLREFLKSYPQGFTLVADWPEDLKHFLESLITGPGMMMAIPSFSMELRSELSGAKSSLPHNALYDARALFDLYRDLKAGK
jgi:hypothetical protein